MTRGFFIITNLQTLKKIKSRSRALCFPEKQVHKPRIYGSCILNIPPAFYFVKLKRIFPHFHSQPRFRHKPSFVNPHSVPKNILKFFHKNAIKMIICAIYRVPRNQERI
jgi:hypothetical protein